MATKYEHDPGLGKKSVLTNSRGAYKTQDTLARHTGAGPVVALFDFANLRGERTRGLTNPFVSCEEGGSFVLSLVRSGLVFK